VIEERAVGLGDGPRAVSTVTWWWWWCVFVCSEIGGQVGQ